MLCISKTKTACAVITTYILNHKQAQWKFFIHKFNSSIQFLCLLLGNSINNDI